VQREHLFAAAQSFQGMILGFESFPSLPEPFRSRSQVASFVGLEFVHQKR